MRKLFVLAVPVLAVGVSLGLAPVASATSYVCDKPHLYLEECDPGNIGETMDDKDRAVALGASVRASSPVLPGLHVVRFGQTLSGIAAKYRYPGGAAALARDNGIPDPNKVRAGQVLVVRLVVPG